MVSIEPPWAVMISRAGLITLCSVLLTGCLGGARNSLSARDEVLFASDADGDYELYVWASAEGSVRKLTDNDAPDYLARWSPDGGSIAFVSYRDGNADIYVMSEDGKSVRRITDHPRLDTEPMWSADGSMIAFISDRDNVPNIYTFDLATSQLRQVTNATLHAGSPVWSPRGAEIAYIDTNEEGDRLAVVETAGREPRIVSRDELGVSNLHWPPPGGTIYVTAFDDRRINVYAIDATSGMDRAVTDSDGIDTSPCLGPAGAGLVFLSDRDTGSIHQLYRSDPVGKDVQRLTFSDQPEMQPVWAPGGHRIAFLRYSRSSYQTILLDVDTREEREMAPTVRGNHLLPQFRPHTPTHR